MAEPKDTTPYLSEPQQVVLALIAGLINRWPMPQSVASLVQHTDYSRDQVYRGLQNLRHAGYAEETTDGWLIGRTLTGAAEAIRQRTAELLNSYLRA